MFDSHCHLHDARMAAGRDGYLARARAAGVSGCVLAGVDSAGWEVEAALCREHADLHASYGLHPQRAAELSDAEIDEELARLTSALDGRLPAPCALGELGLDALTDATRQALPRQERAFRAQLATARERDLPLVLHILRTHGEALRILKSDGLPKAGGVVHSYSGSQDLVAEYVRLGLHLSFAGPVSFPQSRRQQEAARLVPLERLLVETDAPDQAPWSRRPGPSEPAFLAEILEALAIIRGQPRAVLEAATTANAHRLFRLPIRKS